MQLYSFVREGTSPTLARMQQRSPLPGFEHAFPEEDLIEVDEETVVNTKKSFQGTRRSSMSLTSILKDQGHYSDMDLVVKRQTNKLLKQVDALRNKLGREAEKRLTIDTEKKKLEDQNADLKLKFLMRVERLEKELLFYRSEFVEIEKRNDTLESMREDFLKLVESTQKKCAKWWVKLRQREILRRVFDAFVENAQTNSLLRSKTSCVISRRDNALVARVLLNWRHWARDAVIQKQLVAKARRFYETNLMSIVFSRWTQYHDMVHHQREVLHRILVPAHVQTAGHENSLLRLCFLAWRRAVGALKMVRMQEINEHLARENIVLKEKTGRSILMRRQTRIQRSVFHEWHRFAHNEAILRRERARASETESEDLARKYFRIWQKKTFVSRRNQHALQRFREEKQRRMKRKILLAWHSWAFHDKASRARAEAEDFKQKFETLNKDVGELVEQWKRNATKRIFLAWRSTATDMAKKRSVLFNIVSRVKRDRLAAIFYRWSDFVVEEKRSRSNEITAEVHAAFKKKLEIFRAWQYFIKERRRTKMLSHKVSLGLHLKGLVTHCDMLSVEMDDLRRDQQRKQSEQMLTHSETEVDCERLVELADAVDRDVSELKRVQLYERESWENKTQSQFENFGNLVEATRNNREGMEKVLAVLDRELKDFQAQSGKLSRVDMQKDVLRVMTAVKLKVEQTINHCVENEHRYIENAELIRHAVDDTSDSVRDYKLLNSRLAQSIKDIREQARENLVDTTKRLHEDRDQAKRLEARFADAREEIEKLKERLMQEQQEFEAMLRLYTLEGSEGTEEGSASETTSLLDLPQDVDPSKEYDEIIERVRTRREGEAKDRVEAIAATNVNAASPTARSRRVMVQEAPTMEVVTTPKRSDKGTEDDVDVELSAAPVAQSSQNPAKTSKFSVAEIPAHRSGLSPSSKSVSSAHAGDLAAGSSDSSPAPAPKEEKVQTPVSSSSQPTAASSSPVPEMGAGIRRVRSASMISRPRNDVETEKLNNRQLEFEIFRLQKRMAKLEEQLRAKYEGEINRWKEKYEQAVEMMLRADEWKKKYDIRMGEKEMHLRNELEATRSTLDLSMTKERESAAFWRNRFKSTEKALTNLMADRRSDIDKWRALVRYYEEAFGVVSVNLITNTGEMHRRAGKPFVTSRSFSPTRVSNQSPTSPSH